MVGSIRVSLVPLITLRSGGVGMVQFLKKIFSLIWLTFGCCDV